MKEEIVPISYRSLLRANVVLFLCSCPVWCGCFFPQIFLCCCLFVLLSFCLYFLCFCLFFNACLSLCGEVVPLSSRLPMSATACLFFCMSLSPAGRLPDIDSLSVAVCLCACLPTCLFVSLPVCPSLCLSNSTCAHLC